MRSGEGDDSPRCPVSPRVTEYCLNTLRYQTSPNFSSEIFILLFLIDNSSLTLTFTLTSSQTEISFNPKVPVPGRYVVLVHYHQPEHASFLVDVRVDAGREWSGRFGGVNG